VSDYSAETPIDQTNVTGAYRRPGTPLLPWVLVGITAGILAAITIVLLRSASAERQRADTEAQAHANAVARADKAELKTLAESAKVEPLEEQVKSLTEERDTLVAKLKQLDEQRAASGKSETAAAPVKVTKTSSKKSKKPGKKKKRR
jgi:uncharacterized membrane protein YvbJ